jgi:hypothetical protein
MRRRDPTSGIDPRDTAVPNVPSRGAFPRFHASAAEPKTAFASLDYTVPGPSLLLQLPVMLSPLRTLVASATLAVALALGSSVRGQSSFAYEGFDYGATPVSPQMLDGKDGGSGWAGPWIGVNQRTDLISFWPLDFSVWDAGPAGANGTLGGAATYSTEVPQNAPMTTPIWSLFWSSASLSLPTIAAAQRGFVDLTPQAASFGHLNKGSVTAWIKTTVTSGTGAIISVNNTTQSSLTDFGVRVSNGKVQWGSRGQLYAGGGTVSSQASVNDGLWHHVAVTVDGATNTNLYIDGVLDTTGKTGFFGSVQGINLMSIGRTAASGGNQQSFIGQIDDVAVWGSPLSQADVQMLASVGGLPPVTFPLLVPGPLESIGPNLDVQTLAGAGSNTAFESGGYRAVGNKMGDATGNRAGRVMLTPFDMKKDATYYMSCLVRRVDPPSGVITPAEVQITSDDKIAARFGWDSAGNFFGGIDTVVTTGAVIMQPSTEYWVIVKIKSSSGGMSPAGDDLVYIKAYQRSQQIPADDTGLSGQGTNPTNWTVEVLPGAILGTNFGQIWLLQSQAGSTMEVDEIRVGTTWDSVTRVGYGAGCLGHRIGVTNRPLLGASNFSVDLHGAQPNASALLLLGLSPLALPLGGIGAPSCSLLTSAELSALQLTDGAGNAVAPLSIPNLPALYGQSLYAQWVAAAPTQPLPLAFSDGYQMLIGR